MFSQRFIYGGRYCGQEEKGCQEVSQEEGKEEEEVAFASQHERDQLWSARTAFF